MATAFPLSPEEQVMGAIGAPSVGSAGPSQFSGYDLTGALQAGLTPADIAQGMASQIGYRYNDARRAGVTDEQIIAGLMGENAFTAGMKRFIEAGGSSIKGLAQLGGRLNTERALAERTAAEIASANNPIAGGVGLVTGSFADPVALPSFALAPLRAATATGTLLRQGAAQGLVSGVLEPRLTEEDSIVKNILFGTAFGAGLGAGIGKLIDRMGAKAADVVDPVKAAEDANLTKQASKTAIEDLTASIETPAYLRRTEGRGVEATTATGMDDATKALIQNKIVAAEADIARAEERLWELSQRQPERQTAALLRGAPEEQTPTGMGLVERTTEVPQRQVPSLFRPTPQVETPPTIREPVQQTPKLTSGEDYLKGIIAQRQQEIASLTSALQRAEQPATFPVPNKATPDAATIAARDARVAAALERSGQPSRAAEASIAKEAALTPAETQTIAKLQKVLDDNGFKSMDEAIVATGKPEEVAAAQARIDSGNVQTLEQIVKGFRSGGSAAVTPERLYAGTTVFPDVERAVVGAVTGERAPRLRIEPVKNEDVNKLLQDTVGFLGKDLKRMREGGDFSGTLKGTVEAGIQSARKAAAEEGSYLGWLFKEDENGNFVNIDKSWDRGEIAAFMPVVRDATRVYNRLMEEAVDLNVKGDLSDEALQNIMEKMAYPIQIMGIFQAKRTQASRSLNAFKTLDTSLKEGKTVKGFMKAGVPCA